MRCSCFSGVKLSILFWASTRNRGIGMKLANVVEQRWGDVAGMPVRLQGIHRILFYGSIDYTSTHGMTVTIYKQLELRPSQTWHGVSWLEQPLTWKPLGWIRIIHWAFICEGSRGWHRQENWPETMVIQQMFDESWRISHSNYTKIASSSLFQSGGEAHSQ